MAIIFRFHEWASDSGDVLLERFPDAGGGSWNGLSMMLCTIPNNCIPILLQCVDATSSLEKVFA